MFFWIGVSEFLGCNPSSGIAGSKGGSIFTFLPIPPTHPAKPTSLPHLSPPPWFWPCVLYSSSCNPLSSLSPPHSPYLFIFFRDREREGERERSIDVREKYRSVASHMCPNIHTWPGTEPATQACALTRNQTGDLLLCGTMPNLLNYTGQGLSFLNNKNCMISLICGKKTKNKLTTQKQIHRYRQQDGKGVEERGELRKGGSNRC